ncbi:MAG: SIMPL domain-containing protein [Candidatus Gastranaerophilales bacterium]|nr:SIMPL domain-containing protein [Candidatus Gastranaerophilales bacterium]
MKKLIISLFVLTLLASATYATVPTTSQGKITASASEFKYIAPDTANITLTVETTDKNSQKAVELNNQKVSSLTELIKKSLNQNESIKTTNYNMHQKYEYNSITKKDVLAGYTVVNSVTVTLKDTKKAGQIIDIAIKNGATNVSNLSFTLQNTDNVCKELTAKAVAKAKAEAMNVLAPLGKTIDGVASIDYSCSSRTNGPVYRNYSMMKTMATADGASSNAVNVEEGESRVDASVTIVFTIK